MMNGEPSRAGADSIQEIAAARCPRGDKSNCSCDDPCKQAQNFRKGQDKKCERYARKASDDCHLDQLYTAGREYCHLSDDCEATT